MQLQHDYNSEYWLDYNNAGAFIKSSCMPIGWESVCLPSAGAQSREATWEAAWCHLRLQLLLLLRLRCCAEQATAKGDLRGWRRRAKSTW